MTSRNILETLQLAAGFLPVDMSAGANNGDWVSLKNFDRIAIVLYKDGGTAGDDPTITVQQAVDQVGTGAKALNFTNLYRKQGSDLLAVGQWTETTQSSGNTYTNATLAENEAFVVVEFRAEDLDVANGFDFVRATVADIGANAQLGCLFYILTQPRYSAGPTGMPSVLA